MQGVLSLYHLLVDDLWTRLGDEVCVVTNIYLQKREENYIEWSSLITRLTVHS